MAADGDLGIVMRIHRVRAEIVVAACDSELVGQRLPLGPAGGTTHISGQFYGDRRVAVEELVTAVRRCTIANLLGSRTCRVVQQAGLLEEEQTGTLGGVPHAEIVSIPEV
jgi:hypothetical protein